MIPVAFQLPLGLLFQLGSFAPQGLEHVIHQGGSLVGVEAATTHPVLTDVAESIADQGGGSKPPQDEHLQQIALVHGSGSLVTNRCALADACGQLAAA